MSPAPAPTVRPERRSQRLPYRPRRLTQAVFTTSSSASSMSCANQESTWFVRARWMVLASAFINRSTVRERGRAELSASHVLRIDLGRSRRKRMGRDRKRSHPIGCTLSVPDRLARPARSMRVPRMIGAAASRGGSQTYRSARATGSASTSFPASETSRDARSSIAARI